MSHQHSAFFLPAWMFATTPPHPPRLLPQGSDGPVIQQKCIWPLFFVPDTVLGYGEETIKSPIPCLQGTHSVVGEIDKEISY